jgi:hypothetical protein
MTLSQRINAERAAKRAKQSRPVVRQVFNRLAAAKMFHTALAKGMRDDTTPQDADLLITVPLAQLERLRTGKLDDEGFVELNEANISGFCLAAELHKNATPETKAVLEPTQPIFEAAADALANLGERKASTGRYTMRAAELAALRESIAQYRQLIEVSPRGIVCRALQRAAKMVEEKLVRLEATV